MYKLTDKDILEIKIIKYSWLNLEYLVKYNSKEIYIK